MMLRQGWDFERSPHGASQTIFTPGISGVPDDRAMVARSGVCAGALAGNAMAKSAAATRRRIMLQGPVTGLRNTAYARLRRAMSDIPRVSGSGTSGGAGS